MVELVETGIHSKEFHSISEGIPVRCSTPNVQTDPAEVYIEPLFFDNTYQEASESELTGKLRHPKDIDFPRAHFVLSPDAAGISGSSTPKVQYKLKGNSTKKAKPGKNPAVAKPKQKSQKKKKQGELVKWTVYKLVVKLHGSRLPTMDVLKLSFQKDTKRAAFRVMRYPVTMARNDRTGKIIWSINWAAGDVMENEMAAQSAMIGNLEVMADDQRKGSMGKDALAGMINRQLGPDAQQKN